MKDNENYFLEISENIIHRENEARHTNLNKFFKKKRGGVSFIENTLAKFLKKKSS